MKEGRWGLLPHLIWGRAFRVPLYTKLCSSKRIEQMWNKNCAAEIADFVSTKARFLAPNASLKAFSGRPSKRM